MTTMQRLRVDGREALPLWANDRGRSFLGAGSGSVSVCSEKNALNRRETGTDDGAPRRPTVTEGGNVGPPNLHATWVNSLTRGRPAPSSPARDHRAERSRTDGLVRNVTNVA